MRSRPMHYCKHAEASPRALGGDDAYRAFCARAELLDRRSGYGLIQVVDDNGKRWTMITSDIASHRMFLASRDLTRITLRIPPSLYTRRREGWPDEWVESR